MREPKGHVVPAFALREQLGKQHVGVERTFGIEDVMIGNDSVGGGIERGIGDLERTPALALQ